jgi:hypothetical protein
MKKKKKEQAKIPGVHSQIKDYLQAKERGLRTNQTCQHLHLGLPLFWTARKSTSIV